MELKQHAINQNMEYRFSELPIANNRNDQNLKIVKKLTARDSEK